MSPLHRHEHDLLPVWNRDHLLIADFENQMIACNWHKVKTSNAPGDPGGACKSVEWRHKQYSGITAYSIHTAYLGELDSELTHMMSRDNFKDLLT